MKIYCGLCDKVQPVQIDNGIDVKTKNPYQDIVCAECNLVIASGTDIAQPKQEWVGLTDREIEHELTQEFAHWWNRHVSVCRAIETKLKDKNT
jgi:uncharacterized protein YlaI